MVVENLIVLDLGPVAPVGERVHLQRLVSLDAKFVALDLLAIFNKLSGRPRVLSIAAPGYLPCQGNW